MMRRYSCNKYRSYSIRNHYFVNGLFQTDDPSVQQLIESVDGYGVYIHPVETPEEIAAMKAVEEQAQQPVEPSDAVMASDVIEPPAMVEMEEEQPLIATQGARGSLSGPRSVRKGQVIGAGKK